MTDNARTTTPGPRTAWLRTVIVEHATSFQGEADAVALVAEFEDRIRAEARADVDGLVAHPGEQHEFRTTCRRCGEPGQLHIALLGPDEGYSIGPLGDKAEAPE